MPNNVPSTTTTTNNNNAAGTAAAKRVRRPPVHVLSRTEPGLVLLVAYKRIVHHPEFITAAPGTTAPLYLCDAFAQDGSCGRGAACPDVHADVSRAKRLFPHRRHDTANANNTKTAMMAPPVPRLLPAALGVLEVAVANEASATRRVAAGDCLATRALEVERRPLSVCAHFVQKGVCDYGAACQFVHPLVDPEPIAATPTTNDEDNAECSADATASPDAALRPTGRPAFGGESGLVSFVPAMPDTLPDDAGNSASPNTLVGSRSTRPAGASTLRYRHDPYGARGWTASVSSVFSTSASLRY